MKRYLAVLFCTLAVPGVSHETKSPQDISPGAREAIHCMLNLMRSAQGAQNVRFFVAYDREVGSFPVLAYSFVGKSGQRHDVELPIQNHADQRGFRSFAIGKAFVDGGGPVNLVDLQWETECRVIGHIVF